MVKVGEYMTQNKKLSSSVQTNINTFKEILPFDKSFDILKKVVKIYDKEFHLFFIDGFAKDTNLEYVRRDILALGQEKVGNIKDAQQLVDYAISAIEAGTETDIQKLVVALLSGQTIVLFEGSDSAALLDLRTYPTRGIDEPSNEKVLRGARDGFVETIVFNTALIRRRIRDPHLTFEMFNVGKISQTDVAIGYMSDKVDQATLNMIRDKIQTLQVDALTITDESLVEALNKNSWLNPLPRARYTERPDVASAQIMEGKIVLLIDNTPSAMILPVGFLDFTQDVDDFYLPVMTGNYLKLVRGLVMLMNVFLTPVYCLLINNQHWIPEWFEFIIPTDAIVVPLVIQFLILEVSIDSLKIASLNTPGNLGSSLSVIGGLILGEYAVKTGWLIPHSIFYMAVVALSSFTQPSVEFGYSIKFARILLLILVGLFGWQGLLAGVVINTVVLVSTKTLTGGSYLYPIFPFDATALKSLLFRQPLTNKQDVNEK